MTVATQDRMNELKQEVVENIQKLHQANVDSAVGFQSAAEHLNRQDLAGDFRKWAQQRKQQAAELAKHVEINGGTVERQGSWLAELHQSYTSLRAKLSSNDTHAILSEAERGEDHIKKAYEDVLTDTPGSAVNDVLQKQYADTKAVHDRVRDLRDACKEKSC